METKHKKEKKNKLLKLIILSTTKIKNKKKNIKINNHY